VADRFETDLSPFKPGGLFVNPDGTLTGDGYRYLDQLWKRSGGFSDGSWDVGAQVSALESQVGELSRSLEAIQFDVERASEVSESALRQALNVEDKNVVTGGLRTRGLARDAATGFFVDAQTGVFDLWDGAGFGPSAGASFATRVYSQTVDVTSAEPNTEALVVVDYDIRANGGAFQWMYFFEDVYRIGLTGYSGPSAGSATNRISSNFRIGSCASAVNSVSGNVNTDKDEVDFGRTFILEDNLPARGDANYDEAGYRYVLNWYVNANIDASRPVGSSNTGFEAADDTGRTVNIANSELIVVNYKR
jgi:hypothetical protein